MFESPRYGISIGNWRRLGKKRMDENNLHEIARAPQFALFVVVFALNSWLLFAAKVMLFLSLDVSFIAEWRSKGFSHFFDSEVALITLLMMSNLFFCFPILPSLQLAATKSGLVRASVWSLYCEFACTAVLLCVQYPLLVAVLYIGACIVLTGMVLGMAILCLLAVVIVLGSLIFAALTLLTCCRFVGGPDQNKSVQAFAASLTWLFITYLVWVSGVCLSFLFTTSNFQSRLCLDLDNNVYHRATLALVLTAAAVSILSLLVMKCACTTKTQQSKELLLPTVPREEVQALICCCRLCRGRRC